MTTRTPTDDLLDEIVQITRIGAQPGGPHLLEALYPGTREAVRKAYTPQTGDYSDDRPMFTNESTPSQAELQEAKELNRR